MQFKAPPGLPLLTWLGAALALAIVAYGGLVFGNPVLARASAVPEGLHSIAINKLPKARRLLLLAGRLDWVLTRPTSRGSELDKALLFADHLDAKYRAGMLADRLELTQSGDFRSTPNGLCYVDAGTPENLLLISRRYAWPFRLPICPRMKSSSRIVSFILSPDLMTVVVPITLSQANALRKGTRDRVDPGRGFFP